jgi:hypothetical protein
MPPTMKNASNNEKSLQQRKNASNNEKCLQHFIIL